MHIAMKARGHQSVEARRLVIVYSVMPAHGLQSPALLPNLLVWLVIYRAHGQVLATPRARTVRLPIV